MPRTALDPVCGMTVIVLPDTPHLSVGGMILVLQPGLPRPLRSPGRLGRSCDRHRLVLAAGSSRRLGRPKQLLPYRGTTLLDATLNVARSCDLDQVMVTLGGAGDAVRSAVDLSDLDVVDNPDFGTGCGSSIAAAVELLDERTDGVVLLLGDQPGVSPATVQRLVDAAAGSPLGVCRYARRARPPVLVQPRGVRRPARVARRQGGVEAVGIRPLSGDRGRRRRLGAARRRHLGRLSSAARPRRKPGGADIATPVRDAADIQARLDEVDYLVDEGLATALYPRDRARAAAAARGRAGRRQDHRRQGAGRAHWTSPLIRLQCYEGLTVGEALYEWNYQRQLLAIRLAESRGARPARRRPVHRGVPAGTPDPAGDPPSRAGRRRCC